MTTLEVTQGPWKLCGQSASTRSYRLYVESGLGLFDEVLGWCPVGFVRAVDDVPNLPYQRVWQDVKGYRKICLFGAIHDLED